MSLEYWAQAKRIFRSYVAKFFPQDSVVPIFVALSEDVSSRKAEIIEQQQKEEAELEAPHLAAGAAVGAPAVAPAPQPGPSRTKAKLQPPSAAASAVLPHRSNELMSSMDEGVELKEVQEEKEYGVQWEIDQWFAPDAPALSWNENPPHVSWPPLETKFRRIALLAKRFLAVCVTAAPSERIWSEMGNLIDSNSSLIDSNRAAMVIYLRHNQTLAQQVRDLAL
jgi:hAT family C-terminal dimerisation region